VLGDPRHLCSKETRRLETAHAPRCPHISLPFSTDCCAALTQSLRFMSLVFLASESLLAIPPGRWEEKSIIEVAWWRFLG
jgi:hypothetical protein